MTIYPVLVGFRVAELYFCGFLIFLLVGVSIPSYWFYRDNAQIINVYNDIAWVRTDLAIDSAFTGRPDGAGAENYSPEKHPHQNKYGPIESFIVSDNGHITATISKSQMHDISKEIIGKTVVLNRITNPGSIPFSISWVCADAFRPKGMVVQAAVAPATLPLVHTYFYCKAGLQ